MLIIMLLYRFFAYAYILASVLVSGLVHMVRCFRAFMLELFVLVVRLWFSVGKEKTL